MSTRDDILKDLLLDLSRRVDDVREDLAEIKRDISSDLSELKDQQKDCKRNWSYVTKVLNFGIAPASGVGVLAWVVEKLHLVPKQ